MERHVNPWLDRLAHTEGAVLVTGPASAGKTTLTLDLAESAITPRHSSRCAIIAPNAPTVRALRSALLERAGGILVAPPVMTFTDLTSRVLSSQSDPPEFMDDLRRHLLLQELIARLDREGQLTALKAVADTPGLPACIDRSIAELKRSAVHPQDLAEAVGRDRGKSADLLRIYRAYQQQLNARHLVDQEGISWLARDILRQAAPGEDVGLDDISAMAVDGFTDFTPTQLEILALLANRLNPLLITLIAPTSDDRHRLWQWADRTRQRLIDTLGDSLDVIPLPPRDAPADPWSRQLFALQPLPTEPPGQLHVITAAGMDNEVTEVARRIKSLLLHSEGSPPRIALLARSLERYQPVIERVFRCFDLPIPSAPIPLGDVPVVRFLLDVAALPEGNYEFHHVLRVLRNSYFHPAALGPFTDDDRTAAERIIREGNVLDGRETYRRAAEYLGGTAREVPDEESSASANAPLQSGLNLLESLFDLADRSRHRPADLNEALNLPTVICQATETTLVARDLRALELFARAMQVIDPPERIDSLRNALQEVSLPAPRSEAVVDVLDVLDARAMRWDHVFLVGLSEGQFPQPYRDAPLIGEAERIAWRNHNVHLDSRNDLTAREMLLFYCAVTRCDQSLTLSTLLADSTGRAAAPGSFLLTMAEPFGGLEKLSPAVAPEGLASLPAERLAGQAETVQYALDRLFSETAPPSAALATISRHAPHLLRRAASGIWATHRRWQVGACNEYDGRLNDPALIDQLGRMIPQQVFSASQLSTFGQCPWQYLARYILHLEPLIEPQRRLQPVAEGLFCHNVLQQTLTSLGDRLGRPLAWSNLDRTQLQTSFQNAFDEQAAGVQPLYPLLWTMQRDSLHEQLWNYLQTQLEQDMLRAESLFFELGFGCDPTAPHVDPSSRADPVRLDTPGGTIRLRGRIDRIDRMRSDLADGLLIIDYKTGCLPRPDDATEGTNLQMPLYIEALEQLLAERPLGGVFHRLDGRTSWFAEIDTVRGKLRPVENHPDRQQQAMQRVGQFLQAMQSGQFDLAPTARSCRYCPYRQSCHFSPARREHKEARP
jgi:ATP-dependent helicase/DNAse subunit B